MRESPTPRESKHRKLIVIAVLLFVVALGIRLAHFQNEPITDELYHLLAAESWAEDGSFGIADGEYTRASLFTMIVGVAHTVGDGDLDTIRIFCIVIGALLVAVVALWTTRYAGVSAGIIAGLLLAILPGAIFLAQHIRFYSLHALVFFLLAWCIWELNYRPVPARRWAIFGLAVVLLLVGLHLQVTTMVGVTGLTLWLMLVNHRAILDAIPEPRHRWIAGTATAVIVLVLAFLLRDTISVLIETYYASALWNSSDTALYYFNLYRQEFGILWSLAPAAFLVALFVRPAPAFFCTCIFVVAFVVQSLGGMRSERFMFYALPFFFIVWGIAANVAGRALIVWLRETLTTSGFFASRPLLTRSLSTTAIVAVGLFAIVMAPFFGTFAKMTLGKRTNPPDYWDRYKTNWALVAPFLREITERYDVVIASQPLHAIYYLGDVDYALNATTLADIARPGTHATLDPRTGRVLFDDVASLRTVIGCHRSGSVIVHGPAFGNPTRVSQNVADFIESELKRVSIPARTDLLVFGWQDRPVNSDCRLHSDRWVPSGE